MQNEVKIQSTLPRNRGFVSKILLTPEVSVLIPLLILCVITGILQTRKFVNLNNITSILRYTAFIGTLSIGQAMVVMSGEIDLSIGANAGFSGIIFGLAAVKWGLDPFTSILLAMIAGGLIGFINGYLVAKFGLVNFITTLATMFLCRGLQVTFSNGAPVSPLPEYYSDFAVARPLFNLSWLFFIMIGLIIIMELVVRFTTIGRKVQAVGGNKEAALMGGINVMKVKWGAYIFSGVMAGIVGVMWACEMAGAFQDAGMGAEFRTITACAIGGVSLAGGSGSILGLGLGVLLIEVLKNCLQCLSVESNWQLVFIGVILIGAVLVDIVRKNVSARNV